MPSDEELFRQATQGITTRESTDNRGYWRQGMDWLDRFDQSWLPQRFTTDAEARENYAAENWGLPGQALAWGSRIPRQVYGGVTDALVGSPLRLAGTAATVATGPFGLAARLGTAARPVAYGARAIDALEAARSADAAAQRFSEGKNLRGAGNVGLAVTQAAGAMLPGVPATRPVRRETVRRLEDLPPKPNLAESTEGYIQPRLLGNAPPPAQFSRMQMVPPERTALPESTTRMLGDEAVPRGTGRVGTVDEDFALSANMAPNPQDLPTVEEMIERGTRELHALGRTADRDTIQRYLSENSFRNQIQRDAEKVGASGVYEPTMAGQIEPRTRPSEDFTTLVKREGTIPVPGPAGYRPVFQEGEQLAEVDTTALTKLGDEVSTRELPNTARVFDISSGTLTPSQVEEITEFANVNNIPIDTRRLKTLQGQNLADELSTVFAQGRDKRAGLTEFMQSAGYDAVKHKGVLAGGKGGARATAYTAGGDVAWPNRLNVAPPAPIGTRQVLEAPTPRVVTRTPTVEEIRQNVISRGVANPSDQMIANIRRNPELQARMGMTSEAMEGAPTQPQQVRGLLPWDRTRAQGIPVSRTGEPTGAGGTLRPPTIPKEDQLELFSPEDLPEVKFQKILENPEVSPETKQAVWTANESMRRNPSTAETVGKNLFVSMERELEKMGPAGEQLARLAKLRDADAPLRGSKYMRSLAVELDKVDPKTFEQAVDFAEGKTQHIPAPAKILGEKLKIALAQTGRDMKEQGLIESVAENYWPQRFTEEGAEAARQQLREAGIADGDIERILVRERGGAHVPIEKARQYKLTGYRKDKQVLIDHFRDVATDAENAHRFGPGHINNKDSLVNQLIAQTPDPQRTKEVMRKIIIGDKPRSEAETKFARGVRKWGAGTQLSLSAISNMGGALPVMIKNNAAENMTGLMKAFNNDLPEMRIMNDVNLFKKYAGGFMEGQDPSRIYRVFGIEQGQNWLNRFAGANGRGTAEVLFEALKSQPNHKKAGTWKKKLDDLIVEDVDKVLKQDELTDHQLNRAMVRMAELTQGTGERRKLPYWWRADGMASIPQMFLRTSFQVSKAVKDAIKMEPVGASAKLLGPGLVLGEVIGNTKEAARTAAQIAMNSIQQRAGVDTEDKNFTEEYLKNIGIHNDPDAIDRFSFSRKALSRLHPELAKNEPLVRALGNYEQVFAFGMPGEVLRSMADSIAQNADNSIVSGSPVDDALRFFWAYDELNQLGQGLIKTGGAIVGHEKSSFRDVAREGLKRVPWIGRGAAREVETSAQQRRRGGGGTGTSSW